MKVIVSGILLAVLSSCGQAYPPKLEQYEPTSVVATASIVKSVPIFMQRIVMGSDIAPPNVVNAVKEAILNDNFKDLILTINKNKHLSNRPFKRGTQHLVDPYLRDGVGATHRAKGKVAYTGAMDLLDEMVRVLSTELPPELDYSDIARLRNRAIEVKKSLYWMYDKGKWFSNS